MNDPREAEVRRNVDDRIVKPTSINASVVSFCCYHVFGCCLCAGMSRSAPETLICDHQSCHSLWFSMRSSLCVTLMCSERSCPSANVDHISIHPDQAVCICSFQSPLLNCKSSFHFVSLKTTQFLAYNRNKSFQDGQHWISGSCGESTLYQWVCLSFPLRVSPYWCSCLHPNATLENSMLCFRFKTFRKGFSSMLIWSEFELCAPSVTSLLDAREPSAVKDRMAVFEINLIAFDFATTRSTSPDVSSCCLFDKVLDLLTGLKWLQENIEKFMMLNERRR